MANPKRIDFTDDGYARSGVAIEYTKRRNTLSVHGWYDSMVGIRGGSMTLGEFFRRLGITEREIRKAFVEQREAEKALAEQGGG